tara:strand:- start:738 stop:974 length:237 start_codon:yes stop_codon:yes gene_type:complete
MSGRLIKSYIIEGEEYNIYGEYEMYPELDENGMKVNAGFDFYDVYVECKKMNCQNCVNEGYPFFEVPTEKELKEFLDS